MTSLGLQDPTVRIHYLANLFESAEGFQPNYPSLGMRCSNLATSRSENLDIFA